MSFYIVQSHKGWFRDAITQEIVRFDTEESAGDAPKDSDRPFQVVEVADEAELNEYLMGFKRTPILNRSGLR